jgi:hypothetical protein
VTELDDLLVELSPDKKIRARAKMLIKNIMFKAAGPEPVEGMAYGRRKTIISRIKRL